MIKLIDCKDCKMEYRLVDGNCSNCPYIIPLEYELLKYQVSINRQARKEFIMELIKNNV